jgi:type IV secretory pathway component VirB8
MTDINLLGYESFDNIYKESIKYNVENGVYFADGFDYFLVAYLRPIVDRTFYIFVCIISIFIIYNTISLISFVLPIKEDVNVVINERDMSRYHLTITDLSKNKDTLTIDEDILRFLLMNYVKLRETHNYKSADVTEFNNRFISIQNNSSPDVSNDFRLFMSKENTTGPYYYFGKDIESSIKITSFSFDRIKRVKLSDKIRDYFNTKLLPIRANVYYTLTIKNDSKIYNESRKAVLEFEFIGIEKNKEGKMTAPKFSVTSYKNYRIK